MPVSTKITERHRSPWKSYLYGSSVFALTLATGWVVEFDVFRIPGWEGGHFLEPSRDALTVLVRAVLEKVGTRSTEYPPVLAILDRQAWTAALFGRVGIVVIAAYVAAIPIAKWRFQRTPRRLRTIWIDQEIPPWSEGSDAIVNANATLADGISRTGRGIEICPGVALSKEQEGRSILIVGEPGGGKTVAFSHIVRELLLRKVFIICHDVKGDWTARWPEKFILLAPHDTRSFGWAIGRDIVGIVLAREFSVLIVAATDHDAPNWPEGAREILVGIIITLQREKLTDWGWVDLKIALDLGDAALQEFACRYHPPAKRFLALDEAQNFTKNAGSYIATMMAPINKLIQPLAMASGDLDQKFQLSLTAWLDDPNPSARTLILQRAPDLDALSTAWIGSAIQIIATHLVGTRRDRNPGDKKKAHPADVWFLLDEHAQLGAATLKLNPLLEVGRSKGLRAVIGLQNFEQLVRIQNPQAPAELLQLIGNVICFRLNPGPDARRICEERLTTAPVRTWEQNDKTRIKTPASENIRILDQNDLATLRITRDGAQGYLIVGNAAFRLEWPFPTTPIQRESSIRAAWIRSNTAGAQNVSSAPLNVPSPHTDGSTVTPETRQPLGSEK
jgi:hypothetical protein